MLPPERRLHDVLELIEGHSYFTLHAGRHGYIERSRVPFPVRVVLMGQ